MYWRSGPPSASNQSRKRPISDFQGIQWMLADCKTELDAARALTLRAAWLKEEGASFSKEAAMAKLYASEACGRIVDRCLQVHGGYGYVKDFPIERHYRDARVTRIYEGTSEIQKLVIAGQVLESASHEGQSPHQAREGQA